MAISEFEYKKWEKELKEFTGKFRIPDLMRHQTDMRFRIEGSDIVIFEVKPSAGTALETQLIKGSYLESEKQWNIYWKQPDSSWEKFETNNPTRSLTDLLNRLVDEKLSH